METEYIETKCPICGKQVSRYKETNHEYVYDIICENEYYQHIGDKLIKFKTPKHNYYESGTNIAK